MKQRLLYLGLLSLGTQPLQAQTERGTGWWSGGANVRAGRSDLFQTVNRTNTLGLNLTQGTFVRDNVLIGADLRLTRVRGLTEEGFNLDAVTDSRQTAFAATPFVRRFWGAQALRGYVGGGLAVQYSRDRQLTANTKTRSSEIEQNSWQVRPEVQAGLVYLISPRWGVELATRSGVVPIAFTDLSVGLVLLTDVKVDRSSALTTQPSEQLRRGNWLVGGSFSVGAEQRRLTSAAELANNVQRVQTQQYAISPSIGRFLANRWLVGVAVPISRQTQTNEFLRAAQLVSSSSAVTTTDAIGVTPFVKKYLLKTRFGPFIGARAGWQRERTRDETTRVETNSTAYNWRISGGLAYLLGERFIVEGELVGLGNDWSANPQSGESRSRFDITATLRPTLTMSYVFL